MADAEATDVRLAGELSTAPGGPVATVLLAVSGVTLFRSIVALAGRAAFAYRNPVELRLTPRGLEMTQRTVLLGKVLRDGATLIPLSNLASVTREVRYARFGLYAGLLSLVLGTYIGTGFLIDGVRVPGGSPSLLGLGLAAIGVGVALDFALSVLVDAARKTCRLVVTPRTGRRLCIRGLDPAAADRVLSELAVALSAQ